MWREHVHKQRIESGDDAFAVVMQLRTCLSQLEVLTDACKFALGNATQMMRERQEYKQLLTASSKLLKDGTTSTAQANRFGSSKQ